MQSDSDTEDEDDDDTEVQVEVFPQSSALCQSQPGKVVPVKEVPIQETGSCSPSPGGWHSGDRVIQFDLILKYKLFHIQTSYLNYLMEATHMLVFL